jgi:hypothetical protein
MRAQNYLIKLAKKMSSLISIGVLQFVTSQILRKRIFVRKSDMSQIVKPVRYRIVFLELQIWYACKEFTPDKIGPIRDVKLVPDYNSVNISWTVSCELKSIISEYWIM